MTVNHLVGRDSCHDLPSELFPWPVAAAVRSRWQLGLADADSLAQTRLVRPPHFSLSPRPGRCFNRGSGEGARSLGSGRHCAHRAVDHRQGELDAGQRQLQILPQVLDGLRHRRLDSRGTGHSLVAVVRASECSVGHAGVTGREKQRQQPAEEVAVRSAPGLDPGPRRGWRRRWRRRRRRHTPCGLAGSAGK